MPLASLFGFGSVHSLLLASNRKRRAATTSGACTVTDGDTTTTTGIAAPEAATHTSSSKRARHLDESSSASSSRQRPPSLNISATFESSSSSSSPTSSSSSCSPHAASSSFLACRESSTTANDDSHINTQGRSEANTDRRTHHSSNEYYTAAISCAKSRLHAAQRTSLHFEQHLSRAREESEQSKIEVKNAMALVDAVEKKWGVINIESDDEGDNNDATQQQKSKFSSKAANSASVADMKTYRTCEFENANRVKLIDIHSAGESIVHGRYRLHHSRTSHNVTGTHNAQHYTRDDGPFLIQNTMYDVCIFERGGYGDKVRWCIGLVPCLNYCGSYSNDVICMNNMENNENGIVAHLQQQRDQNLRHHDRSRNFALAYIYYWMEVDAKTEFNITCLLSKGVAGQSNLSAPSWRVCHGMHPLPVLEDVTGWRDTRCWWHVWKK